MEKWCEDNTISTTNRAYHFGDGCFTTLAVRNGKPELWSYHLQRLQHDCGKLHILFNFFEPLSERVRQLSKEIQFGGLKIIISRGEGGRGYSVNAVSEPIVTIHPFEIPSHYSVWQQSGIALSVVELTLGHAPSLAGIKHLNRLEQVLIKQEIENKGDFDGVVSDVYGNIVETSIANIFWLKKNQWYTPALTFAGVNGVMKQFICDNIPALHDVKEVLEPITTLSDADAVFISNSLMAVTPITEIGSYSFNKELVLPIISQVNEYLSDQTA
ncbi:aminodeoxychorismate lyase [Flocculibacter collagenilyticus]|uniref:aminodeoxychorismate lyase n=1 Tax=Flocculibacter collagenilyticus TaxID=2744479 RepID=UPI0018F5CF61|nr:aminodeoxychorismate lyase [Flocculibacter collagenilyticus]